MIEKESKRWKIPLGEETEIFDPSRWSITPQKSLKSLYEEEKDERIKFMLAFLLSAPNIAAAAYNFEKYNEDKKIISGKEIKEYKIAFSQREQSDLDFDRISNFVAEFNTAVLIANPDLEYNKAIDKAEKEYFEVLFDSVITEPKIEKQRNY